jgi:hypothetical protein
MPSTPKFCFSMTSHTCSEVSPVAMVSLLQLAGIAPAGMQGTRANASGMQGVRVLLS